MFMELALRAGDLDVDLPAIVSFPASDMSKKFADFDDLPFVSGFTSDDDCQITLFAVHNSPFNRANAIIAANVSIRSIEGPLPFIAAR